MKHIRILVGALLLVAHLVMGMSAVCAQNLKCEVTKNEIRNCDEYYKMVGTPKVSTPEKSETGLSGQECSYVLCSYEPKKKEPSYTCDKPCIETSSTYKSCKSILNLDEKNQVLVEVCQDTLSASGTIRRHISNDPCQEHLAQQATFSITCAQKKLLVPQVVSGY